MKMSRLTKLTLVTAVLGMAANSYAQRPRRVVTTDDVRGTAPTVRPGHQRGGHHHRPTPHHGTRRHYGASMEALVSRLVITTNELRTYATGSGRYGRYGQGTHSISSASQQLHSAALRFQQEFLYHSHYYYNNLDQDFQSVVFAHQSVESLLLSDRNLGARQAAAKVGAQLRMIEQRLGLSTLPGHHGGGHYGGHYDFAQAAILADQIETKADQVKRDLEREFRWNRTYDEQLALTSAKQVETKADILERELQGRSRSAYALTLLDDLSDELYELEYTLPYINVSYIVRDSIRNLRMKVERLEDILEHRVPRRTGRRHRGY